MSLTVVCYLATTVCSADSTFNDIHHQVHYMRYLEITTGYHDQVLSEAKPLGSRPSKAIFLSFGL